MSEVNKYGSFDLSKIETEDHKALKYLFEGLDESLYCKFVEETSFKSAKADYVESATMERDYQVGEVLIYFYEVVCAVRDIKKGDVTPIPYMTPAPHDSRPTINPSHWYPVTNLSAQDAFNGKYFYFFTGNKVLADAFGSNAPYQSWDCYFGCVKKIELESGLIMLIFNERYGKKNVLEIVARYIIEGEYEDVFNSGGWTKNRGNDEFYSRRKGDVVEKIRRRDGKTLSRDKKDVIILQKDMERCARELAELNEQWGYELHCKEV